MPATAQQEEVQEQILRYHNEDASGGENHKYHGRDLAPNEFTVLTNVDISNPGQVSKRAGTTAFANLATGVPVRGMLPYVFLGTQYIYAVGGNKSFLVSSSAAVTTLSANPTGSGYAQFAVANNIIYTVDYAGNVWKFASGTYDGPVTISNAAGTSLNGTITSALWFLNRMWWTVGDFVYFSDVGNPESITQPPMQVRVGDGATIRAITTYTQGLLLIFKYGIGKSPGSIHIADVSSDDPTSFFLNVIPQFDGLNLISPQMVTRMGNDQNAEIAFYTLEGRRTLQTTSLDKLVQPSTPFSDYEIDNVLAITSAYTDGNFSVFYNDELLDWLTTGANTTPNLTLAYQTKVQKQSILQGWTTLTLMNGTAACQCTFGTTNNLYVGTTAGTIVKAFSATTGDTFTMTSKRVDFDLPDDEKEADSVTVVLDGASVGNVTGTLLFDDGTNLSLGTLAGSSSGAIQTITVPILFFANAQTSTRKRWYDIRLQLTSTSAPVVLSFTINAIALPNRQIPLTTAFAKPGVTAYAQTQLPTTAWAG